MYDLYSQGGDSGTGTQQHIGNGNDVIDEAKSNPDNVTGCSISDPDNLKESVRFWNPHLARNAQK